MAHQCSRIRAAAVVAVTLFHVTVAGASVAKTADTPTPPKAPQASLYAQAFGALEVDDFDRARRIENTIDNRYARKALRWYRLVEQRRGGDFHSYLQFIESNPDWPWQYTLRHRAEGVMPSDLPDHKVLRFFDQHQPASPYGADRYADALVDIGRRAEGRAILRQAWVEGDFPYEDERSFYDRYNHILTASLHRKRLERLIWERQYRAAERQLKRVSPGYRRLAEARIRLARMEAGVDAAIDRVPPHLRDHPGLIYERARWRKRKGRYQDTAELLDPPTNSYPRPRKWWPLRHWLARTALGKGDISRAYRVAASHGARDGLAFAQAEWLAGWLALRFLDEPRTALSHFERLYDGTSTPISRARGAYWAGRAADKAGMASRSRRWFETAATRLTTFYGQLASARLGDDIFLALPRKPQPSKKIQSNFNDREMVRVIRAMAALGRSDHVDPFVRSLGDGVETRLQGRLVADLAMDIGRQDLAVALARDLRRRGLILPTHLYPKQTMPIGDAGQIVVDQSLLLSIARQESSFDAGAVSPAGAFGLMQLMPATARHVAKTNGLPFDRQRLLHDASYNLKLGSAYMNDLLDRFDGSVLLAIAAYNAGPSRVSRWLDRFGDPRDEIVGPIDWIESIPISETRNYVQRVLESYMIYRHRVAPTRVAIALDGDQLLKPREQQRGLITE